MEVPSGLRLLAVLLLVLANGFFVATEFAIVAVRRSRLEELVARGESRAQSAMEVVQKLDVYIAACQLGITMASLALGWIGEPALAHLVERWLEPVMGAPAPALAHTLAIAVAFSVITALHIVVGELAPKGLALQKPESTVLWVARPIRIFYLIFRWPTLFLNSIGNGLLSLLGMRATGEKSQLHSVAELQLLVRNMEQVGVVEPAEARIAARAFEFADISAGSIMTPRVAIEAVSMEATLPDLAQYAAHARHDKLPVYEATIDDIVSVVHVRDILRTLVESHDSFDMRSLARPVLTVPEAKKVDALLEEMRLAGHSVAVVVDEYGGTAGIVTLEDIAQALVGRMDSPLAHLAGERAARGPGPGRPILISGLTRIPELEELTGLRIDDSTEAETVGGLVMEKLGHIPKPGDTVDVGGHRIRVEKLDGLRVDLVRVMPMERNSSAD